MEHFRKNAFACTLTVGIYSCAGCSAYFSSIGSTKQSVKHARKRPFFKVAVLGGTKARSDSDRRSPRKFPSSYVPQESKAATLSAPAEEVQAEEPVRSRRGESMLAEIDPAGPGHAETSAGCASLDASVEETRVKAQHLRKHFPQARQQVVEARLLWSAKLGRYVMTNTDCMSSLRMLLTRTVWSRLAEAVARHEKEIEAAVGNLSDILAAVRDLSRASADSE